MQKLKFRKVSGFFTMTFIRHWRSLSHWHQLTPFDPGTYFQNNHCKHHLTVLLYFNCLINIFPFFSRKFHKIFRILSKLEFLSNIFLSRNTLSSIAFFARAAAISSGDCDSIPFRMSKSGITDFIPFRSIFQKNGIFLLVFDWIKES